MHASRRGFQFNPMAELWPHFTKENPCPACGHYDWTCRAGNKAYICQRIGSQFPSKCGGFYHFYDDTPRPEIKPEPKRIKKEVDFSGLHGLWMAATDVTKIEFEALNLGVSSDSLFSLEACQYREDRACRGIAIPMRDGDNKIIGIQLRFDDGTKKCVTGSRGGLFIPQCETQKIAYICEGMSNAAALLTMGFFAIGRFNCNSGGDMLKVCLKRLKINRVVIVADNDSLKSANDKTFRPGQDGARKLKKELGLSSCIFSAPSPCKDVRQLLIKLGVESARNYISSSVENKIWTKV